MSKPQVLTRRDLEAELRGALEEEITHLQQTQGERTVAATGGSRSGAAGPWVLYTFLLERDFLVPDATPVIAQIGNDRLSAQIVSIQGMEITLALQRDLGPTIARVEVSVDPSAILERILTRLEDPVIAGLSDSLARMTFGYESPCFGQAEFTSKINISSEKVPALGRALGSQIQFIWGPPGTGKTQVLAALCEVLVENGESVLLTSHTNVAVDEAILRAAGPPSGDREQGPLFEGPAYLGGKLLRYGPPKHAELERIIEHVSAEAISSRLAADLEVRLSEIHQELDQISEARRPLQAVCTGLFDEDIATGLPSELQARLSEIDRELHQIREARRPLWAIRKGLLPENVANEFASRLQARLSEIGTELEAVNDARRKAEAILRDWRKAEHFDEEVRSRERALDGALASLNKRSQEYETAGVALARARERLEDALNPRGLRRLFKKDPRPFQMGVSDSEGTLRLASQSLDAAETFEHRARTAVDRGRAHARQLKPSVPKAEALRRMDRINSRLEGLDRERSVVKEKARQRSDELNSRIEGLDQKRNLVKEDALRQVDELDSRATRLKGEQRLLEEKIAAIIETVIRDAQLVGTTLTRATIDDVLSKRSFDTVIIDEASMAPLPLVYLAALVAEKRVILVGDFRQLPPIVQSPESSELAHRWLGRDIFHQAGIDTPDLPQDKGDLRADLWEQHRMAPAIRQFASDNFYGGRLRDFFDGDRADDKRWRERPPVGRAVCFVDTTSLGAWSQRSPGARPSKFNIYSALVATELAELLVQDMDKNSGNSGSHPVGIITPYRAQSNLLRVLLQERGLQELVHSGTVHSFQGTESKVIIFDYVEDEPYWKAGPLLLGEGGERLMNVAVTRARHRLFVLGSYAHVRQQLKRSKLWDLVEYARGIQQINAEEFLRTDFHRAVADANARISHGNIVDFDNAPQLRVLSERDFFAFLDYDLKRAKSRVVLFSPFLGLRAADVMPRLKECVARGRAVYVVTRPLADVDAGEMRKFYATTHRRLEQLGVRLVFFRDMHHKLVFIDDRILYIGGLNPLSHRHTAEIMDRWDSKDVFKTHAQQTRLDDLLAMWEDPNDRAMRTCPRPQCKGAPLLIVAPVTHQQYDPIYWGCTKWPKCDYKRRFQSGPRRSGQRICDKCGTAMRLERKPSAVWWMCPSCRARRKVQEGEPTQLELGAVAEIRPGRASAKRRLPPRRRGRR